MEQLEALAQDPEFAEWDITISGGTLSGFQRHFSFSIRPSATGTYRMSIRSTTDVEVIPNLSIEEVREQMLGLRFVYVHLQ